MTLQIPFDNSFAKLPRAFYAMQSPAPVVAPELIVYNHDLGRELGITPGSDQELADVFAGNTVPDAADPLAQLYAGHQFGNYNPQLGDGRALLLGEVIDQTRQRRDIQLKGSGPTPFSRRGDGRAWLGPVLREYVVSEAMHALGIPTTRALAAVRTGEPVYRETVLPGAVLTRVASSHLRVGTFQIFAQRGQIDELRQLTDYAIARHHPDADGPMGLLKAVINVQAELVAAWMSVGFIHGVMNTDNCTISGETIDYGPCAFLDAYHPGRVFSSIDQMGRYAYGNQPRIIVWNMAQLATALLAQLPDPAAGLPEAQAIVETMPDLIDKAWVRRFGRKIGIEAADPDDVDLITDLLQIMAANEADFTNAYRGLIDGTARDQFLEPAQFDTWSEGWKRRIENEQDPEITMRGANPAIIPRNHQIEAMITAAVAGDDSKLHHLMNAFANPYDIPDDVSLTRAPLEQERVTATFCGT